MVPLAIDVSTAAIRTHQRNFKDTHGVVADLIKLGPSGVLAHVTAKIALGERIGLIGGPPCQGFSRGNTNSRSDDPRNELPSLYIQIVRSLRKHYTVDFVVFENVLGMKYKKHLPTFHALVADLKGLEFDVTENELCSLEFGVPQKRRRIILTAMRNGLRCQLPPPRTRKGPAHGKRRYSWTARTCLFCPWIVTDGISGASKSLDDETEVQTVHKPVCSTLEVEVLGGCLGTRRALRLHLATVKFMSIQRGIGGSVFTRQ